MDELTAWLRATIQGDKALAEAAPPAPWTANTEHDEVLAADGIAVAEGFALSGRQLRAAVDHITRHDPRDTIARCEADLELLDEHKHAITHSGLECLSCHVHYGSNGSVRSGAGYCRTVRLLAYGYRHRDGWQEGWAP